MIPPESNRIRSFFSPSFRRFASLRPLPALFAAGFLLNFGDLQNAGAQELIRPLASAVDESATATEQIVVVGRANDLLEEATTSSQGSIGAVQLAQRPILRRGELLEAVPGVVISQHSGEGKANQYYLRGFNLDHGTDFALSVDGVPINNRTHAHGQGYADINFIIPELVERIDYSKGPLLAETGDFSAAGSANFLLFNELPYGIATVETGQNEYVRLLLADTILLSGTRQGASAPSPASANQDGKNGKAVAVPAVSPNRQALTFALEWTNHDGPFDLEENFQRFNGLLRYYAIKGDNRFTLTATTFYAVFDSPDQIPRRAIKQGLIDRLGFIDRTVGGETERHALTLDWQHFAPDGLSSTRVTAYGLYYNLDLFSNFTYLLDDPVNGDQFNQVDDRYVFGLNAEHTWKTKLLGADSNWTLGLQYRGDLINALGLYHTDERRILSATREDDVFETSLGLYGKGEVRWTPWFRSTLAVRGDVFYFDVDDRLGQGGTGSKWDGIVSPKLSLVFGPWAKTELYASAGTGFHSNDARGVIGGIDPATDLRAAPANALVRSISGEIGARTSFLPGLVSTVSLFCLYLDSELVYVGDAGTTEASNGSRRYGVEWANFYQPAFVPWLTLDADISYTQARFEDAGSEGDRIPGSVAMVATFGAAVESPWGLFGALRGRYYGPRPLIEDGSVESKDSLIFNLRVGYRFKRPNVEVALSVLNLFDADDNDIEYYYASRLSGEPAEGVDDVHLRAVEPRTFRGSVTWRF